MSKQILSIQHASELFQNDLIQTKKIYHDLCRTWHPDVSTESDAVQVFQHIQTLYEQAVKMIESGTWAEHNTLLLKTDVSTIKIRYYAQHEFELGTIFVSDKFVSYVLPEKNKWYYENFLKTVKKISYANDNMRNHFQTKISQIHKYGQNDKNEFFIVLNKTKNQVMLKDLLAYKDGQIEHTHVAWMVGQLYNVLQFFLYNGHLNHNAVTLENVFVDPVRHECALFGWFYVVTDGHKLKALPKSVYKLMPDSRWTTNKLSTCKFDLLALKCIVRQMLGNAKDIPKPFDVWTRMGATTTTQDFTHWESVLKESYGKREFVKMAFDVEAMKVKLGYKLS